MSFTHAIDTKWFRAFVRRPWSVPKAFWFAVAAGALSPVLKMFLFRWLPWRTVPFVFFSVAVGVIAASSLAWLVVAVGSRIRRLHGHETDAA
jgi:hypothetical protein